MEKQYLRPGELDRTFQRLDNIVEKIHKYAVEPIFSQDIQRRIGGTSPSFDLSDDFILKLMIELIAFSQQVRSSLIVEIMEKGVFERVFKSYSPADVAMLNPVDLKRMYWDNPLNQRDRLAPLRFPNKLTSMVDCARSLMKISSQHGSFMHFIEKQRFPLKADSTNNQRLFWESFDNARSYLVGIGCPFFAEFTSLCHLLEFLGFDCAKPDSVVMGVAERLEIIGKATRKGQRSLKERKKVIQIMQMYSVHKNTKTPVVDLYFLIYGGQTDAKKFVTPSFYSLAPEIPGTPYLSRTN
jgi:hypothetical protein